MMLGVILYNINNNQYIAPRFEGHRFDNLLPFGHVPTIKVTKSLQILVLQAELQNIIELN